jgi:hypothetical protein
MNRKHGKVRSEVTLPEEIKKKKRRQKEKSYFCIVVAVRPRQECGGSSSVYGGCGFLVG